MDDRVERPPGIVQRLQDSPQRVADSVRASALWLALLDGPLDAREFHEVGMALTHEPEGVPLDDIAAAFASEPLPADLPRLFRFLRGQRSPKRTESLIDLYIRVAAADGRISEIERHALVFLSDLLAAPASLLRERFDALLGIEFEPPADLSDPDWFATAEATATAREVREKAKLADPAQTRRDAGERSAALRALGLKDDATPLAMKAAWRKLARQHHPDRQPKGDEGALAAAGERFHEVQKAWQCLKDDADA